MNLTAYFDDAGSPATGLSATITVWNLSGTIIVNAVGMTEVAGGFYTYDFTTYDDTVDYCIRADGGATLDDADRYVVAGNELNQITERTDNLPDSPANEATVLAIESDGDWIVEGAVTAKEAIRANLASIGGTLSGADTTTVIIKDTTGAKDRITATVDEHGNRSAMVLDLT